jgi:signal peptidase I
MNDFFETEDSPRRAYTPPQDDPYALDDDYFLSGREEPHRSRNPIDRATGRLPHGWRVTIDWIVTIAGAVAIVLAIKAWVVNPYRIPTPSMEPALHCAHSPIEPSCRGRFSDRVLANRFIFRLRDPKRGEIVVFRAPPLVKQNCSPGEGNVFVKRIIGLPGETLAQRKDGIYVNGKRLDEPYIRPEVRAREATSAQVGKSWRVPQSSYFMMGDNRSESCDSRMWLSVPRENLIGKVFMTYWPPNRISLH